ncbi:MAG: hypothetical protein LUH82_02320 [Clostridiales bacterium]|nr:hypothetical protein [Clostridiales bacterium]
MKYLVSYLIIFLLGGQGYCTLEIIWRGRTHYSMFFAGGLALSCLVFLGLQMNKAPIVQKCIIGAVIITLIELLFGYIFNIKYQMGVWDYSNMPLNFAGQICLPYSLAWLFLCFILFKWVIKDDFYTRFF